MHNAKCAMRNGNLEWRIISGEINSDLVKNLTIQIFLMSNNGFKRLIYLYKSLPVLSFTTNDGECIMHNLFNA